MRTCIGILVAVGLLAAAGCSRQRGPSRYDLRGSIVWNGKPVPVGTIVFAPDLARGNNGPGASVDITAGSYATRPGFGTIGGPHVAIITAYDGVPVQYENITDPIGTQLFPPRRVEIDLPRAAATQDFDLTTEP